MPVWFLTLASMAALPAQQAGQQGGMNPIITIAVFLLMLGLLVVVHELGHFLVARWAGIAVEEFGVGFPPRALTLFERNGVKYTLNWLPLGGFVRFAQSPDGMGETLYGAGGSLAAAPPWRKIAVMLAGPLMNLLLAMLIFGVIFSFLGVPITRDGQRIGEVFPNTPAAAAGLQPEDVLLTLAGRPVDSGTVVGEAARASNGQPIAAEILRGEQRLTLNITPGPWTSPAGESYPLGFGFSYGPNVEQVQANPLQAFWAGITHSFDLTWRMVQSLAALPGAILGLFSPAQPAGGEPIGPVGIARATGEVIQQPGGFLAFWNLTAILSLNLFILNLLPIPALDGSHIVFALIEWLRGGKKVPPEKEALVHAIGFAALMGLMLLITVNDVINAFRGVPVLGS